MTRYGLFSDVHGNFEALTAVYEDMEKKGVEKYFCLGDIVGYGANPNECLELVDERCDVIIRGNHDDAILELRSKKGYKKIEETFKPHAFKTTIWTYDQVKNNKKSMGILKYKRCYFVMPAWDGKKVGISHAAFYPKQGLDIYFKNFEDKREVLKNKYLVREYDLLEAARVLDLDPEFLITFQGHTHKQKGDFIDVNYQMDGKRLSNEMARKMILSGNDHGISDMSNIESTLWDPGGTYQDFTYLKFDDYFPWYFHGGWKMIVNVGSVGQPRDGDPRAAWTLFDSDEKEIYFYRVEYDFELTAKKIIDAGLPEINATRLSIGR